MTIGNLWRSWSSAGLFFSVILIVTSLQAEPGEDLSCAWFSADPDDRAGPPITFSADLDADAQRAPTESPGVGHADFPPFSTWRHRRSVRP
jgi:hypothetical protein